jgi:SNF2 family DNA or RNA helicase
MIKDQLIKQKWGVMVIDEVHFCKNTKANRTQTVLGGKRKGICQNAVYVWGLTGTPMSNAPIDLWPIFRSMGRKHLPEKAQSYDGYTRIFCKKYKTRWGTWDVSGAANVDVLHKCLFKSGFALRRTKDMVLTELPAKQYRFVPMEMTKLGAEMRWGDLLRTADLQKSTLGLGAAELAEARKDLAFDKIDAIIDYINETDEPLVVFGWHREFLEKIAQAVDGVLYYGSMSPRNKEKSKEQFLTGQKRVFVANIQSAGTGLDGLQHISSHAIFAEIPWTYTEIAQAADRLHRMGQKNPVLIDLMVLKGGIEEYILRTVLKKEKLFEELTLDKSKGLA